ncbi:MAG: DUF2721 domain-containing protein [Thermoanaerobaculia bacterium]
MAGLLPDFRELSSAVAVLSAMITPAVLILASGSILTTTSSRLIRVIDRVRAIAAEAHTIGEGPGDPLMLRRRDVYLQLLQSATRRAVLLQRAMTLLYLAISGFILTSLTIGGISVAEVDLGWIALLFGFVAAVLLLSASLVLIFESRHALAATNLETEFILTYGQHHLTPHGTNGETV